MHIHLNDQHRHGHSLIHRLDPRIKVVVAVLFILTVSLTPFGAYGAYAVLLAIAMGAAVIARIGAGYVLRRSLVALPFALAAVTLPFTVPGTPLLTLPLFGGLAISEEGVMRFVSILTKSWISLQMAIVLITVTSFPDLLWGLRALYVPQPLIAIVGFMHRYLFVIADEVLRLLRARAARSGAMDGLRSGGSLVWRGKVAGQMAGSLMIRSFERSERIYNAMLARGYQGQIHMLAPTQLQTTDLLTLGTTILLLAVVLFLAWW
jgi:cobalt/nickel transport system permease protein